MKLAVLMGSPRKKDTNRICKLIESSLSDPKKIEFDFIYLKDLHVEDCRGCDQCFQKGENCCPCQDDIPMIKECLLQADGVIFASPVYACQITGLLKRTLDRLSYLFHRQELVGKPALTVVTTGGGGQKETGKYLKMTACGWGCHLVGEIRIISPLFFDSPKGQSPWGYNKKYHDIQIEKIRRITKRLEEDVSSGNHHVPSFYDIFMFQCLRSKTYVSKADYDFWEERGWLDGSYFYKTKLSPMKKVFAKVIKSYVDASAKKITAPEK